jgi:phospholipid/cholesterol/gamma-HCH transport system substrate-binding protein
MPSQKEVRWSQLKVGLLVSVAVVLLVVVVFLMTSDTGGLFARHERLRAYFENADGLEVGAPVSLEGVTVGSVVKIRVDGNPQRKLEPVEVTMEITNKYASGIRRDTRASLTTVGVLGDTVVDLDSKESTGAAATDGDELPVQETSNLTDVIKGSQDTLAQLNAVLAKTSTMIDDISHGKGSVGRLVTSDDMYRKTYATMNNLQTLTQNLNDGKGTAGKLLVDDTLYNRLNDAAGHLQKLTTEIDSGQGTAGMLIRDPKLYQNLSDAVGHMNSLLADVDAGKGALGLAAKNPDFAKQLMDALTQVDALAQKVNGGKGTLGKLANDEGVYTNLNQLLANSNDLVKAVRSDPKRYLSIKMKVF